MTVPTTAECQCTAAEDLRLHDPDMAWQHDQLAAIEDMDPLYAVELVVEILSGAFRGLEPDCFPEFAAQHNWRTPARVGWVFTVLDGLSRQVES